MARLKNLVAQTRNQCANEVRKRERTIEGLKRHVGEGGRARGSGKAVGVATVTVVAGVGGEEKAVAGQDNSGDYDLRGETNEFLTELARSLSEENENLGGLLRRTAETLKSLSGWEADQNAQGQDEQLVKVTEEGYEAVASEMDAVIEHLRTLLTNPSFVPLEEVEMREEEIHRLREGWERMEARWKDAVAMMDGWRKRMMRGGQTVNLEELRMGLRLSPLKAAGVQGQNIEETEEGDTQADIDAMDDSQVPGGQDEEPDLDEMSEVDSEFDDEDGELFSSHNQHQGYRNHQKAQVRDASSSPGPPPQLSPLRESLATVNRQTAVQEKAQFTPIIEENTWDLAHLDNSSSNLSPLQPKKQKQGEAPSSTSSTENHQASNRRQREISPVKNNSRLPRPASALERPSHINGNGYVQSPLTMASIAAKLAATEREADAARVRAKLKAAKMSAAAGKAAATVPVLAPPVASVREEPVKVKLNDEENADRVNTGEEKGETRKRKASGRLPGSRASRRRSTLSPWELESLISGQVLDSPVKNG
jgi:hypothetical protein